MFILIFVYKKIKSVLIYVSIYKYNKKIVGAFPHTCQMQNGQNLG